MNKKSFSVTDAFEELRSNGLKMAPQGPFSYQTDEAELINSTIVYWNMNGLLPCLINVTQNNLTLHW